MFPAWWTKKVSLITPLFNPIEELWRILGDTAMKTNPQTKKELIESLVRVWHHQLNPDLLKSLVQSMPRRCSAVIKAKGGSTKY